MNTALFWVITQRGVVIYYRRFRIIYRSPEDGPDCCPETSVRNYQYSLRHDPEERSSQLECPGIKIFVIVVYNLC